MTGFPLPPASPASQGVDARGIRDFLQAAEHAGIDLHSLAVARHGHVVAAGWWSPYAAELVHLGYSLSKSFTATAVGFLVTDGLLSMDDALVDHLPVDAAALDPAWRAVRLRDALSMTLGHTDDPWPGRDASGPTTPGAADPALAFALSVPPHREPGTFFTYNQRATYLTQRAVEHTCGRTVPELLGTRLLEPLGLPPIPWHTDVVGHPLGFSGAHLPTATILALAQLYLDGGRWRDEQLLDPDWVAGAVRSQGPPSTEPDAPTDWLQGYGWSFWQARHGFRGDGAFGQFAIVLPEQDAVVAITSEVDDMQAVLDLVWAHLLPALSEGAAVDTSADAALAELLAGLAQRTPATVEDTTAHGPGPWSFVRSGGDLPSAYAGLRVERAADGWVLTLPRGQDELAVPCGEGAWTPSVQPFGAGTLAVRAAGGWAPDGHFRAELLLVNTPHRLMVDADPATGRAALGWRRVSLMGHDPAGLVVAPAGR